MPQLVESCGKCMYKCFKKKQKLTLFSIKKVKYTKTKLKIY